MRLMPCALRWGFLQSPIAKSSVRLILVCDCAVLPVDQTLWPLPKTCTLVVCIKLGRHLHQVQYCAWKSQRRPLFGRTRIIKHFRTSGASQTQGLPLHQLHAFHSTRFFPRQ